MHFKPFSLIKLELLKSYVPTWLAIIRQRGKKAKWFNQFIIDGFSGDGTVIVDKDKKYPGSALLFAQLLEISEKLKLITNDIDPKKIESFKNKLIENHPAVSDRIECYSKDFNDIVDEVLESIKDNISIFFLDPSGVKSLPWKTIEKIGQRAEKLKKQGGRTEIFLNYMQYAIDLNAGYDKPIYDQNQTLDQFIDTKPPSDDEILGELRQIVVAEGPRRPINDEFYGTSEWREMWDTIKIPAKRREVLLTLYEGKLRKYFKHVLSLPIYCNYRPLYYLIYATNNSAGNSEVKRIVRRITEGKTYLRTKKKLREGIIPLTDFEELQFTHISRESGL